MTVGVWKYAGTEKKSNGCFPSAWRTARGNRQSLGKPESNFRLLCMERPVIFLDKYRKNRYNKIDFPIESDRKNEEMRGIFYGIRDTSFGKKTEGKY